MLALTALTVLVAACGGSLEPITLVPTEYTGTWEARGPVAASQLAIYHDGDRYYFRWTKTTSDDTLAVLCDWKGKCEEIYHGKLRATYQFENWIEAETGYLRVRCVGKQLNTGEEIGYMDELVVEPEGDVMIAHQLEVNGRTIEDSIPTRRFRKISDEVEDPPVSGE
ncbi:hypothetical protein ABI59_03760 [Acidobacteria bacterium Mor1]|nr:hypothetical protein ABI59_03760 [Acidobacteria bacterium Mor1]